MDHTILVFIKVGAHAHILDLYENGTVYMNSLSYFKKVEDKQLRGDPHEGAQSFGYAENGIIKMKVGNEEFKYCKIEYGEYLTTGNVFSLYAVSSHGCSNPHDFVVDDKNMAFGTHCLMIKEPGVFIERLSAKLKFSGYRFKHGFVKYYDRDKRMEKLTPLHKSRAFEYQREFRFFVESEAPDPITVQIGSMESYAEIYEAKDLVTLKLRSGNN